MSDDTPVNLGETFIALATALPELLGDIDAVFAAQTDSGQWSAEAIDQATGRIRTLANDQTVTHSRSVTTVLGAMAVNYDALTGVDGSDSELVQTLQGLFSMTPALMLNCNTVAADMEAVGALITHLNDPAWPESLSDSDAETISVELLASQDSDESEQGNQAATSNKTYPPIGEVDLKVELASDINPMLRDAFMTEIPERVREFSDCVGKMVDGTGDDEILFSAQRAAHTIKGSAHVSGVSGMGWLTHLSEDIVEFLTESRSNEVPEGAYELLQDASDCLESQVEHLKGVAAYPEDTSTIYSRLRDMYFTLSSASGESVTGDTIDDASDSPDEHALRLERSTAMVDSQEQDSDDENLTEQDRAFITLATALPELMGDVDAVFTSQSESGQWNSETIDQAAIRIRSLESDQAVTHSLAATTVLGGLAENFDALKEVDGSDSERIQTLHGLFHMTPALLLNCNNVAADMEAVGALITHLNDSAWPKELSESDAEAITIELLSDPESDEVEQDSLDSRISDSYPSIGEVDLKVELASDINPLLREAFMTEIPDRVREFSECVGKMVAGTGDDEILFTAQRAAHTIKGSAHVSGVTGMGWLTHLSEDILEFITESKSEEVPDGAYELLQEASDCLECQVEHLKGMAAYPEETQVVYSKLRAMYLKMSGTTPDDSIEDVSAESGDATQAFHDSDRLHDELTEHDLNQGSDSHSLTSIAAPADEAGSQTGDQAGSNSNDARLTRAVTVAAVPEYRPSRARLQQQKESDELAEKSIHLSVRQLKSLQNLAGDFSIHNVRMDGFRGDTTTALNDLARQQMIVQQRLEDLNTLLMYQGVQSNIVQPGSEGEGFDALEMDQYTELHSATNLAYEAVVDAQEMTNNLQRDVKVFGEILTENNRVSRDFNDDISNIRMVTSTELTPRLQRVARQTAKATGKTVELVIEGEDVQFDRDLYNPLAEALLHAIRNAIDHGIEAPEERLANDKPETGTVTIRLQREAGEILISCHDDGAGLDFDAIRDKAVSSGQIEPENALSQSELADLVFAPGFSTRQDVSQISGRGMGMNIVFEAIRTRHGSVEIESDATNGTTVRMRMPMSLTSMHLIIAKFGEKNYAIPSNSVEQLVLSDMGEVITRDNSAGLKEQVFLMGDTEWKVFALGALLGSENEMETTDQKGGSFPLVLLRTSQDNYAVRLHHASNSGVMVVKSFGDYIQRINGILGGAILSDGSMCPVLDLAELATDQRAALQNYQLRDLSSASTKKEEFVLVVDDSLSARRALVQLLIDAGFKTREARDGIDAIEVMDKATPRLLVTDLEMPRMNGVELVQHIRSRDSNNEIPIIMITSRSTQKHKSRAKEAGVNDYVNKPWDEDKLIELVAGHFVNQLADVA